MPQRGCHRLFPDTLLDARHAFAVFEQPRGMIKGLEGGFVRTQGVLAKVSTSVVN